jgi:hypothetical protein
MYKVAENLLLKFGTYGTINKKTYTTPDATEPWSRTATTDAKQVLMVVTPWGKEDAKRYFGEDITGVTQKGIILWDDSAPVNIDDEIEYDGKTYMAIKGKPIKPAGTGIIYVFALGGPE